MAASAAAAATATPSAGASTPCCSALGVIRLALHRLFIGEHPLDAWLDFSKERLSEVVRNLLCAHVSTVGFEQAFFSMRANSEQVAVAEVVASRCCVNELVDFWEVEHGNSGGF